MNIFKKWWFWGITVIVIIIILKFVGMGFHTCYSDPRAEGQRIYCVKDPYRYYSGKFDVARQVYQKYVIRYVGVYRTDFVSLWSGSNIIANPWFVLSEKWTDMKATCYIYDSEEYFNKRYKDGLDSVPPSYDLTHKNGEKIYYIRCYKDAAMKDKGEFFSDETTESVLKQAGYNLPQAGQLSIPIN